VELRPGKAPRFVVFGSFLVFGADVDSVDVIGSTYLFSDGSPDNCMSGEEAMMESSPVRRIAIYDDMLAMLEAFRVEMQLRADKVDMDDMPQDSKAPSARGWVFTEMGYGW
jgi:hypothetical protein